MKSRIAPKAVCLFVLLVFAIRAFADDAPTFSDPEVNLYVKSWSKFSRDYVAATAHWKTADRSTLLALVSRVRELQAQAGQVVRKVKPGEKQKFARYMMQCFRNILEFSSRLRKSINQPTGVQTTADTVTKALLAESLT